MRNDRMTVAMVDYVAKTLPDGRSYTESDAGKSFYDVLQMSMEDSTPVNPVFFILSPGTDPVLELEKIAKKRGFYEHKFHRVALGEGQDVIAMDKLKVAHVEGHWVVLENIHLMPKWNPHLEKKLDDFAVAGSHPDFRVFLSAEPSTGIPIGILERSIKLTNEPPQGLKQNLKRAFATIDKEVFEFQEIKIKSITFVLCHFHAIIIERIKFGPKGWNRAYPFNQGDLMNSATVLANYLEGGTSDKIPWNDLRYIIGEILYGGHITDDLDRELCRTYLSFYLKEELLDEMELYPYAENYQEETFRSPPALSFDQYFEYIDSELPPENPVAFGLHPNTEIAVKTEQSEYLFKSILELQPRSGGGGSGTSVIDTVKTQVSLIMDEAKDMNFKIEDIKAKIEGDPDPYQNVFLQEAERLNQLSGEMMRSLVELELGLNGDLQMSQPMEDLQNDLYLGRVPKSWAKLAYPSLRPLSAWVGDLGDRHAQVKNWDETDVSVVPKVVNLALFFNPQSFLTAVMQRFSQETKSPLDKLVIQTVVTRKTVEQTDTAARIGGAYVSGLFLEGARWNWTGMLLEESAPREMFFQMPVVLCAAVLAERLEKNGVYMCPVFKTQQRGPTFVFTATLRTKLPASKWVLAGVVMVLEAEI
jgi:dynein heavy chain